MSIRANVDLRFAYAVIGVPQNQEEQFGVRGTDVTIEEQRIGKNRRLCVTLHDEIEGLREFNQVWLTHEGQIYEGVGRMSGAGQLLIDLYHDQPEFM